MEENLIEQLSLFGLDELRLETLDKEKIHPLRPLKVCSLFSGIGGFETGFFEAFGSQNVEVVFASEIDPHAAKSYEALYGVAPYGDITKIKASSIPDHDVLVGGFPCQAFSIAGKRQGFEDTRGTLFFDVVRILKEKKPRTVILENVKNLISHDNSQTIEVILTTLSEIGYYIDFDILNSRYFNSPQSRDRIYIIGQYNHPKQNWIKGDYSAKVWRIKKKLMQKYRGLKTFNFCFPAKQRVNASIADILESNPDPKYFLPNHIAIEMKNRITSEDLNFLPEQYIRKITDIPHELHKDLERQRRLYSITGCSPTLLARSDTPKIYFEVEDKPRIRKLTPLECLRLQGFPVGYYSILRQAKVSDTQIYKQVGNAVTTNVIQALVGKLSTFYVQKS